MRHSMILGKRVREEGELTAIWVVNDATKNLVRFNRQRILFNPTLRIGIKGSVMSTALGVNLTEHPHGRQFMSFRPRHRPHRPKQNRGFDSTLVRLTLRRYGAIALARE